MGGGITENDRLLERALELGRMLGQSDEYKALREADERLKGDSEASALLKELQRLDGEMRRALAEGKEPSQSLAEEYEGVRNKIQALTRYQQFVAAQSNFDKLMHKVNERMAEGMKKGSASPIITL